MLLWHEGHFASKAAGTRHLPHLAQQRGLEAAGATAVAAGQDHQRTGWNSQRKIAQAASACSEHADCFRLLATGTH